MKAADVRRLFPRARPAPGGPDGYCRGCGSEPAEDRCAFCTQLYNERRRRAEIVARFLGVPTCVKCGSVWLHFDERGAPVCAFVFCTECGKIQPRADR